MTPAAPCVVDVDDQTRTRRFSFTTTVPAVAATSRFAASYTARQQIYASNSFFLRTGPLITNNTASLYLFVGLNSVLSTEFLFKKKDKVRLVEFDLKLS